MAKRGFRRFVSRSRRGVARAYRKHKTMSGMTGDVMSGLVVGGAIALGGPTINKYVPSVGPLSSTTVGVAGAGVALKAMHKGGRFADATLILGSAMVAGDLLRGIGGGAGATGGVAFY